MNIRLPEFYQVAAGQLATVDLLRNLRGYVINRIKLKLTNLTPVDLEEITVRANTSAVWQDSGDRTDKRMKERGVFTDNGFLVIDFTNSKCKEMMQQYMGAIDTMLSGIVNMGLELKLKSGLPANIRIEGWADVSTVSSQLGETVDQISKVFYTPQVVNNSSARFPIDLNFDIGSKALITKIHFIPTAGITIKAAEVRKNNIVIHEVPTDVQNHTLKEFGKVPQAGWYTLDFIMDDNFYGKALTLQDVDGQGRLVPAAMQYYLDLDVTTQGTITTVVEYLEALNGRG